MNVVILTGRLGADPDLRTVGGDKRVVNFRIAVDRKFKRGKDTAKETAWVPCEAWDTGADLIGQHFKKGDLITVIGSLKQDEWDDKKTGEKRTQLKLRVERFEFPPTSKGAPQGDADKGEDKKPSQPPADGGGEDGSGDPIPF